jgi:hypothetical protein
MSQDEGRAAMQAGAGFRTSASIDEDNTSPSFDEDHKPRPQKARRREERRKIVADTVPSRTTWPANVSSTEQAFPHDPPGRGFAAAAAAAATTAAAPAATSASSSSRTPFFGNQLSESERTEMPPGSIDGRPGFDMPHSDYIGSLSRQYSFNPSYQSPSAGLGGMQTYPGFDSGDQSHFFHHRQHARTFSMPSNLSQMDPSVDNIEGRISSTDVTGFSQLPGMSVERSLLGTTRNVVHPGRQDTLAASRDTRHYLSRSQSLNLSGTVPETSVTTHPHPSVGFLRPASDSGRRGLSSVSARTLITGADSSVPMVMNAPAASRRDVSRSDPNARYRASVRDPTYGEEAILDTNSGDPIEPRPIEEMIEQKEFHGRGSSVNLQAGEAASTNNDPMTSPGSSSHPSRESSQERGDNDDRADGQDWSILPSDWR